uniref:Uncharacterized protein n=1 Tax=Arundo donax TaxID=35708 RepID=A0A0A9CY75_ARUDO
MGILKLNRLMSMRRQRQRQRQRRRCQIQARNGWTASRCGRRDPLSQQDEILTKPSRGNLVSYTFVNANPRCCPGCLCVSGFRTSGRCHPNLTFSIETLGLNEKAYRKDEKNDRISPAKLTTL